MIDGKYSKVIMMPHSVEDRYFELDMTVTRPGTSNMKIVDIEDVKVIFDLGQVFFEFDVLLEDTKAVYTDRTYDASGDIRREHEYEMSVILGGRCYAACDGDMFGEGTLELAVDESEVFGVEDRDPYGALPDDMEYDPDMLDTAGEPRDAGITIEIRRNN